MAAAQRHHAGETRQTGALRPHPLNAEIYGEETPDPAFIESIAEHGIITPIVIDQDDQIIAGHRRWQAAQALGLAVVPVEARQVDDPLDALAILLDSNLQREKAYSQRMREADQREGLESARAQVRMAEGGRIGGLTAGRGRPRATIAPAPIGAAPIPGEHEQRRERTYQRERFIWDVANGKIAARLASQGAARVLVARLDAGEISVSRAERELREADVAVERRSDLPPEPTPRPAPAADADPRDESGERQRPARDAAVQRALVEAEETTDVVLGADAILNDSGVAKHLLLRQLAPDVRGMLAYDEDAVCAAFARYPEMDHILTDIHRLRRTLTNIERRCTVIVGGKGRDGRGVG